MTTATQIQVDQLVETSAQVLDAEFPGWYNQIDVGPMFSIVDPGRCVLSQLGGGQAGAYADTIDALQKSGKNYGSKLDGFYCAHYEDPMFILAWRNEVEKRKHNERTDFLVDRLIGSEIPVVVQDITKVDTEEMHLVGSGIGSGVRSD